MWYQLVQSLKFKCMSHEGLSSRVLLSFNKRYVPRLAARDKSSLLLSVPLTSTATPCRMIANQHAPSLENFTPLTFIAVNINSTLPTDNCPRLFEFGMRP